jgi:hypothetical protein
LPNIRFSRIDANSLGDHYYLSAEDNVAFIFEYTSGAGFGAGHGNQLVLNLKKPMERRGKPEWRYKQQAIAEVSAIMSKSLNDAWLSSGTIVPVPPSLTKADPLYDDRLMQILRGIRRPFAVDVREIVVQRESTRASHQSDGNRLNPADLEAVYTIDEGQAAANPVTSILIFDDVLTTGAHYRAMQSVLKRRFPGVPIAGAFVARRIFKDLAAKEFGD